MRVSSYPLVSRIRWPRTIAWQLVALLLVSAWLQTDNEIFPGLAGIGFLLSWPVSGGSGSPVRPDHVRLLLLVDSTFAGLLIRLFISAPVIVVCLAIMLLVSPLIVGSVQLLVRAMPPFAPGSGYRMPISYNAGYAARFPGVNPALDIHGSGQSSGLP